MKKIIMYSFILIFFISGCSLVSVGSQITRVKPNEKFGAGYEHLEGKLYNIFCGGNGYASYTDVDNTCLYEMAKLAYENDYKYFTVLNKGSDTDELISTDGYVNAYGGYSSYSYLVKKHSIEYLFLLINKHELNKYKNYYIVADYYTPQMDNNTKKDNAINSNRNINNNTIDNPFIFN